jgi:enoyl-CoA hydratase/carnithine racemase
LPAEAGFKLETELFSERLSTQDQKEGVKALFEKRKPKGSGILGLLQ